MRFADTERVYQDTERGVMYLRILVVEDSRTTRRIIRAILETREWKICGEAENGRAGVTQFRKLRPDVVVIDLSMPGISGIETASAMSKVDPLVPLILFTLSETKELYEAAREAGICALVSKARAWDLIATIDSATTQRSGSCQRVQ
jgi:DNA-binding NarL/FixJ family response regulator